MVEHPWSAHSPILYISLVAIQLIPTQCRYCSVNPQRVMVSSLNITTDNPSRSQSQSLTPHACCYSHTFLASVPKFAASSTTTSFNNPTMKSSPYQENPNMITPRVLRANGTPIHSKKASYTIVTAPALSRQTLRSFAPAVSSTPKPHLSSTAQIRSLYTQRTTMTSSTGC